ncbi:Lateral signaling target protein 2 [Aphelenchoides avenae]|nr:Lateral signaling target protein 2 [Aphelenchus avenae]
MLLIAFPNESERACRDYRVKFPDEILHDNLPGQLWFGAECLAAGSNIVEHEVESEAIRPMAKALTKHLDKMRELLKDQALRDPTQYPEKIKTSLKVFDLLFAEFEFNYVSAMVPVKSVKEHDAQLDVAVLFSEALERSIKCGYITQEQIDDCDPNVMIALPRLAIVWGLLFYQEGALNIDGPKEDLSEMFRHFHKLLKLIRDLLTTLTDDERRKLELSLVTGNASPVDTTATVPSVGNDVCMSMYLRLLSYCWNFGLDSPPSTPSRHVKDAMASTSSLSIDSADSSSYASRVVDTLFCAQSAPERSRFSSSEDLIHRLFVCIAGVADQLQTNYSSDVRKVLKMVLQPVEVVPVYEVKGNTAPVPENEEETGVEVQESLPLPSFVGVRWVPDSDCDQCTACQAPFTMIRRRHHCRNCGRIFCGHCSSNQLPIPELGYDRRVRVCNLCFLYKINPFSPCGGGDTADPSASGEHASGHASPSASSASSQLPSTSNIASATTGLS